MKKSTHRVEVIRVNEIRSAPNADNLEIIYPFRHYQVVVKKGDFQVGDLAAYVPPDTVVPLDHPAFNFLTNPRVTVRRFRGNWSQGLLVPAPAGAQEGDDLSDFFDTRRYEPPEPTEPGQKGLTQGSRVARKPPGFPVPTYDIEPLHRYAHLLFEGEDVLVTEKIHGSQARFTYRRGQFHAGSKGVWRQVHRVPGFLKWLSARLLRWFPMDQSNAWTRVLSESKALQGFLREHPGWVVLGEVYGDGIQDMKYGCKDQVRFAAFHVLTETGFLPQSVALSMLQLWKVPTVPVLYAGPFDVDHVLSLAEGKSVLPGAGHLREGVVVCPEAPRGSGTHLKVVSNAYLERNSK
jgi:RNA ligase (TIGR02306 family)